MLRQSLMIFLAVAMTSAILRSDDAVSALKPCNGIEWRSMTIKVVDDQQNPLPGVAIKPWALRAGNAHGGWDGRELGAPRETITNESGEATIDYPKEVRWVQKFDPVINVSLFLKHPDYVARAVHQMTPGGDHPVIPELALQKGTCLRIAGVSPGSDQPLENCHLLIENSEVSGREYVSQPDGWLQSSPISSDRRWFRVVCLPPGEPPRFSRLVAWNPEDPATTEQRVEVRKGSRIEGRISDDVPRPVQQGHVVVWCGSPVRNDDRPLKEHFSPIFWQETTMIHEDGTFVFDSLPSGYLAQFFGMADNFISSQPNDVVIEQAQKWFSTTKVNRVNWMRYGHILRLAGNQTELLLPMEQAGEAIVTCVDPNGDPVPNVHVSSWPNQIIVGAGSTVFCNRISSIDRIRNPSLAVDWHKSNPYTAKTGLDGKALIRNLPIGKQSFMAGSEKWVSAEADFDITVQNRAELTIPLISK